MYSLCAEYSEVKLDLLNLLFWGFFFQLLGWT